MLTNAWVQLHLWRLSRKKTDTKKKALSGLVPYGTIQMPLYNEK